MDVNLEAITRCADFFFFSFLFFNVSPCRWNFDGDVESLNGLQVRHKISIWISRWVEHIRNLRLDLESELHSDLENSIISRAMIIT